MSPPRGWADEGRHPDPYAALGASAGASAGASPEPPTDDAEAAFREKLREKEHKYLCYPHAWPQALPAGLRAAREAGGTSKEGWFRCLYCGSAFELREQRPPRFCSVPCSRAATRVRREYREEMLRELFAEGASDREMAQRTGLSEGVVREKRLAMGLVRPPSSEREEDRDAGEKSAAAEDAVCADLMRRGYEVFRRAEGSLLGRSRR